MLKHYLKGSSLTIELDREYHTLSTAAYPKTYHTIKYVVFNTVPKDFFIEDVDNYCINLINSLGLESKLTSVFLTGVDVSKYVHVAKEVNSSTVEVFTTLGIDWISCLDSVENIEKGYNVITMSNTINVAVFVDEPLNEVGLLDLFRLVSEVKGSLITLLGPTCISSPSIGTPSDATLVASPIGSKRYSGSTTEVGRAVISALAEVFVKWVKGLSLERYVKFSLGGIGVSDLHKLSMDIYRECRIPNQEDSKVSLEVINEILNVLKDPNLLVFLKGVRFIEFILALNAVPGLTDEYLKDSPGIIVDELVGKALAEYVNGFKGLLSYYWVERLKEGSKFQKLSSIPPITDDVVTALVGSVLSKVYDKYSRI